MDGKEEGRGGGMGHRGGDRGHRGNGPHHGGGRGGRGRGAVHNQWIVPDVRFQNYNRGECRDGVRHCRNMHCAYRHGTTCVFGTNCTKRLINCRKSHRDARVPKVFRPDCQETWNWRLDVRKVLSAREACYEDPIQVDTVETARWCTTKKFSAVVSPRLPVNSHGKGAARRTMVCRYMVAYAMRQNHLNVLAPFDFGRLHIIAKRMNEACNRKNERVVNVTGMDAVMVACDDFKIQRELIVEDEHARDGTPHTICILNDQFDGVSPEEIATYLELLSGDTKNELLMSTMCFQGEYGVVADQVYRRTVNRDGTSHVRAFVDDVQDAYEHGDTNWVYTNRCIKVNSGRYLYINYLATLAGRDIYRFKLRDSKSLDGRVHMNPVRATIRTQSFTKTVEDVVPLLLRPWVPAFLKEIVIETVDYEVFNESYAKLSSIAPKSLSSYGVQVSAASIRERMDEEVVVQRMKKFFPDATARFAENTELAIIYGRRITKVRRQARAVAQTLEAKEMERDLQDVRSPPWYIKYAPVAVGAAIIALALRKHMPDYQLVPANALPRNKILMLKSVFKKSRSWTNYLGGGIFGGMKRILGTLRGGNWDKAKLFDIIVSSPILECLIYGPWNPLSIPYGVRLGMAIFSHMSILAYSATGHSNILDVPTLRDAIMQVYARLIAAFVCTCPWWFHVLYNIYAVVSNPDAYKNAAVRSYKVFRNRKQIEAACLGLSRYGWKGVLGVGLLATLWKLRGYFTTSKQNAGREFLRRYNNREYGAATQVYGEAELKLDDRGLTAPVLPLDHAPEADPDTSIKVTLQGTVISKECVPDDDAMATIQPLIACNGWMLVPPPGTGSLLCSLTYRNAAFLPEATHPEMWRTLGDCLTHHVYQSCMDGPLDILTLQDWLDGRTGNKFTLRQIKQEVDLVHKGESTVWLGSQVNERCPEHVLKDMRRKGNKVHAKRDEMLHWKKLTVAGYTRHYVKPRTIQATTIGVQLQTQPSVKAASLRFKRVISEPFKVTSPAGKDLWFWLTWASGMQGEALTRWLVRAKGYSKEGVICVIAMGDDSFTVAAESGCPSYEGIDYGKFDQSQKAPMLEHELRVYGALGIPLWVLDILNQVNHLKARHVSRTGDRPSVSFSPAGPRRVTGSSVTSLGNTINNLTAIMIHHMLPEKDVWPMLGLTAVVVKNRDLMKVPFLRGIFWHFMDGTDRWASMPSTFIKLGKVQTVIRTEKRLLQLAYGQGSGMGDVSANFPILSELKHVLINLGKESPAITNEYKPLSDYGDLVDRDRVIGWMIERYDTSEVAILSAEAMIARIRKLPAFVGCKLFAKFMDDYA